MDNEVKVSICCTVFNHEKYLRKCLDGFVNQKTNFEYEAIIHDDLSTDNSVNIIKEYQEKYPDIIKPIFEEENQYSKGINILNEIIVPISKGKYIAVCEGDDYWCDENKLQEQYDLMEKNKDCSMCSHNTIWHDLTDKQKDKYFNDWKEIHYLTEEEIFFDGSSGWNIHTSSFFIRREFLIQPKFTWKYWFGDYTLLTYFAYCGKIVVIPKAMSVYNANNVEGSALNNLKNKKCIKNIELQQKYLKEFNEYTKNKFDKTVNERISALNFEKLLFQFLINNLNYKEFCKYRKEINEHEYYKKYFNRLTFSKKIKFYIKHEIYIVYKLFWKVKNRGK